MQFYNLILLYIHVHNKGVKKMRKLDLDDIIGYGMAILYILSGLACLIANFMYEAAHVL